MWTERSDLKITWSRHPYTDAYKSLDVLGEFIEDEQHRDVFQTVDHVALFTGSVTCQSVHWRRYRASSDSRLNGRGFDPRPQHYRSVGTGMGDRLRAGILSRYVTSHQANSASYPLSCTSVTMSYTALSYTAVHMS